MLKAEHHIWRTKKNVLKSTRATKTKVLSVAEFQSLRTCEWDRLFLVCLHHLHTRSHTHTLTLDPVLFVESLVFELPVPAAGTESLIMVTKLKSTEWLGVTCELQLPPESHPDAIMTLVTVTWPSWKNIEYSRPTER